MRGSIACPGHDTLRYGGNTSCVEVRCGDHLFIFDGGTGLRELGKGLSDKGAIDADIFFSHAHLDHIIGVPFFRSIFDPENTFRLWAGHLLPDHTLEEVMRTMMTSPLFPVPPDVFSKKVSYHDFKERETLTPRPGVTLRTAPLNHPNGATGYRVEFNGHAVCYVTDTEHEEGKLDENIVELARDADYLIYDCTYTDTIPAMTACSWTSWPRTPPNVIPPASWRAKVWCCVPGSRSLQEIETPRRRTPPENSSQRSGAEKGGACPYPENPL